MKTKGNISWAEIEDVLADAIADSLEMDWQPRDGARACVAALQILESEQ